MDVMDPYSISSIVVWISEAKVSESVMHFWISGRSFFPIIPSIRPAVSYSTPEKSIAAVEAARAARAKVVLIFNM